MLKALKIVTKKVISMDLHNNCTIRSVQYKGADKALCEDAALLSADPDGFLFAGLADGQSMRAHCREGALMALCAVRGYLSANGIGALSRRFCDEVRCEMTQAVRQRLLRLARSGGVPAEEYASTLCCFACDTRSGDFMLVHLGDGCLLGVTSGGQVRVLSGPEFSFARRRTCLTTSREAMSHLRLSWGNCRNYEAIYLMTDGAGNICRDGWVAPAARQELLHRAFWSLSARLERRLSTDDASLMMIAPHGSGRPVIASCWEAGA